MSASFEEKSAWVTLLGLLAAYAVYFAIAARMMSAGVTEVLAYAPLFAVSVMVLVAFLVAGHVAVAVVGGRQESDERDRLIAWRAEHGSSWILGAGVVGAIFALAAPIPKIWVAHSLLATLFLAEIANRALQIYYYRRGV